MVGIPPATSLDASAAPAPLALPRDWRALYPFTGHHLDVGPGRLHYVDEGPRDADPVVCVHGNPTWSFYWRELVRDLRDEHRVIALDHLGCGLSDRPRAWPYRLAGHVDNLERLLVHLDLHRVTLVVHDWGGAIGMGAALRQRDRIARVVVLNTAAFRSPALPLRIAICRIPVLGPLAVQGLNLFARAATVMATAQGLPPAVRDGLLAPYGSWSDRLAILRFVQDIPMDPGHPSWPALMEIEKGLPRLADKPFLILWGERDWCFTPAFRAEWERRFPRAEVHAFPEAGHYVMEDARDEVLLRIRSFLTR